MAFNPLYRDAMDELFRHLESQELPKIVHTRLGIALEKPIKLFCIVGKASPAIGKMRTPQIEPGLYASNLLVKLLVAVRTPDWELVAVLLEQAISPIHSESR
jgi:hypothetical protein